MPTQKIMFTGSQQAELAGRLDTPDAVPRAWAVFAHCFTCSKDSKAATYISRALARAGFGVLRFDFTGLGSSEGDFANTDFSSNVDDLVAAADWLRAEYGAPALLIGHSLGGAAVLAAAGRIADCKAVATIAAPFDPAHVIQHLGEGVKQIEAEGKATVQLGGRPFTVRRAFVEDLNGQQQTARIHGLRRPLMVLHAPLDATVGIDNAGEIFQAALHPKSFVALDGADHLLTRPDDAQFAADVIAAWAQRYLAVAETGGESAAATSVPAGSHPSALPEGAVQVVERNTAGFAVDIRVGRHQWIGDEPVNVGGDDLGPGPYDMLAAALGACTAMTLRMYARHKQWPLAEVAVQLTHGKVHASDCAECETRQGKV
ncbi:MAG: bifunctional alpha/beta hydrolase/OsmC family protein, partial [Ramlibacter sp.]